MGKSAPKAPDYTAAAEAQASSSREVTEQQTWANRPDQFTPWGSQTWENQQVWDPSTQQYLNRWAQNTQLTPDTQASLDAQMQLGRERSELGLDLTDRMRSEYGSAMDWSGFTRGGRAVRAPGQVRGGRIQGQLPGEQLQRGYNIQGPELNPADRYRQDANDAIYNQWADRALPQQERDTDAMRTQLYNMGFKEGDQGYDRELEKLRQSQGDQQRQAQYQATIGSGAEAQRMLGMDASTRGQLTGEQAALGAFGNQAALGQFGMGAQQGQFANQAQNQQFGQAMQGGQQNFQQQMQSSQYQNQLRQQQIAEAMQQRGFSLNEINALLSGQQVSMPQMPGFQGAQASQATQNLSAAQMQGQASLDAFNAQQAATQGMMSGVGSMAGGFAGFSDRRLKRDIAKLSEVGGINIYSWVYLWGEPSIGVMADEVPHAIMGHVNGFAVVDYRRIW